MFLKSKINTGLKVPHMGWNKIKQDKDHPLWKNIPDESFFYFVHSYYVSPLNKSNILATTTYDLDFASALYKDNIAAVQFHPEKSSNMGLQLLENFINWNGVI